MKRRFISILAAAAVLIAVLAPVAAMDVIWSPFRVVRIAILERLPTPMLARILIGPAGSAVVADSRSFWPFEEGVAFYGRPYPVPFYDRHDPAGEGRLCAIEMYDVPGSVVTGGRKGHGEPRLTQEIIYGVLAHSGGTCDQYRDFGNMVRADFVRTPEAAFALLKHAQSVEAPTFPISCVQLRSDDRTDPCDGVQRLRHLDLRALTGMATVVDAGVSRDGVGEYLFTLREPDSYLPFSQIRIATSSSKGGASVIRSVLIEVQPRRGGDR